MFDSSTLVRVYSVRCTCDDVWETKQKRLNAHTYTDILINYLYCCSFSVLPFNFSSQFFMVLCQRQLRFFENCFIENGLFIYQNFYCNILFWFKIEPRFLCKISFQYCLLNKLSARSIRIYFNWMLDFLVYFYVNTLQFIIDVFHFFFFFFGKKHGLMKTRAHQIWFNT